MNLSVPITTIFAAAFLSLSPADCRFFNHNEVNKPDSGKAAEKKEQEAEVSTGSLYENSAIHVDTRAKASGNDVVLKLTADDMIFKLYVDGDAYQVPHRSNPKVLGSVKIPSKSRMIAVECLNFQGYGGFLAFSTDESLQTDSSWKCTASDQLSAWILPTFDDKSWPSAAVTKHQTKLKGVEIPNGAKWIWTTNYNKGDQRIYCRGKFKRSENVVAHTAIIKQLDGLKKQFESVESRLPISSIAFSPQQKQLASALTSYCIPLLIQQNVDGSKFFRRSWKEYKVGFNRSDGNFWIGNELLSQLTTRNHYRLRIDLQCKKTGKWYYAKYNSFVVHPESTQYTLHVSGYSGNSNHDSMAYHNGMKFSTYDKDNDKHSGSCAQGIFGGFWLNACHRFGPNAAYPHFWWSGVPGGLLETSRMWLTCR